MASESMTLSPRGRVDLTQLEAIRQHYYNDQGNNCTAGVGTLVHYGPCSPHELAMPAMPMSAIQQRREQGIAEAERVVRRAVTQHSLTQAQFDAAVHFAYNVGTATRRVLDPANNGNMPKVARRMRQYIDVCEHDRQGRGIPGTCRVSPGLVNRRQREIAAFVERQP